MSATFEGRMGYFAKRDFAFYATHVSLCVAFLLLPYIFTANGSFLRIPDVYNGHDRVYMAVYFLLLLFFYFNYYFLIPRFFFGRRRMLYFLIILLILFFFLFASFWFDRPGVRILEMTDNHLPPPGHRHPRGPHRWKPNQNAHTVLIFLTGVLASLFLSINRRLQASERDKMEAELSLLKAQINPHFLFNTLNSIYALAIRKDDRTATSIVQLSGLMRYIMNAAGGDKIQLSAEIGYIDNYIALQRSRFGDTVKISYTTQGEPNTLEIVPLILISFIENAFKHGVNPDAPSEILIGITISGKRLHLQVGNKKVRASPTEGGIGLKNTQQRLDLAYSGNYHLDVRENQQEYHVNLTLDL